ncbi:unnamed protein product [Rhizoctonia solani]|uniref:AAA+ ATPase domain-containing protein n=1 Tax=Rhizoctonia solani TaxID=456999 RepID=A0A8H2XVU0_9AGAM|nr:unnamed protein product [Rhizoctonia solani]
MSTSTIKKLAAQLRPISSLDSGSRVPSQESEKGFNQYDSDERARTQSMTEGSSHAETTVDMDITPQLPSSYYLGFKYCNQFWDQAKDQWTETYRVAPAESPPVSNRIMAYKRKSSAFPHSNHIWVEIRGSTLFELLRPYFQSFSDFTGVVPGIDARHIYMQRKALQELIPRPTKHRVLSSADRTMYTDLQHLLDYIEQEFADVTLELEHMKQEEDPHVRWDFLWALLAPGELLETKESVFGLDMVFKPKNWLYMTPNPDYSKPSYTQIRNSDLLPVFQVQGEFLEWTGRGYTSIRIERTVQKYTVGFKIRTYLGIQTVNSRKEIQFYGKREKVYQCKLILLINCAVKPTSYELSGVYHFNYHSYIMWEESDNDRPYAVYKGPGPQSQIRKARADGRVMIDMMSFRRFNPDRDVWNAEDLSDSSSQTKREAPSLNENSPDLCLLPPAVFGWSFELRKWGQFMVEKLSPITFEPNAFSHLVLPEDDKQFIKALVEAQAVSGEVPAFEDVVPGKGSGLVMLFHGSTGTGKTLTAEAISEHLQLPLYKVTSEDLDNSPGAEKIEVKLKRILEISSLWKAVILIDEADEFIQERSSYGYYGTSSSGAFLRLLEYHSGIVILTTNYLGQIDKAVKSRINFALRYKNLDSESRRILWKKCLLLAGATIENPDKPRLEYDFSKEELDELAERNTNGREIKNVVQTARALARSTGQPLSISHIQKVWKVQDAFEAGMHPVPTMGTQRQEVSYLGWFFFALEFLRSCV